MPKKLYATQMNNTFKNKLIKTTCAEQKIHL